MSDSKYPFSIPKDAGFRASTQPTRARIQKATLVKHEGERMSFIGLRVRTATVVHGYDTENREQIESVSEQVFVEKLIAISRIQSISEKYVLVTSSHGRVMYWEYEEGMAALKARLSAAGLLIA